MLRSEVYIYLLVEGNSLVARVDPRCKAEQGNEIKVVFDRNKIHLFDKDTQKAII